MDADKSSEVTAEMLIELLNLNPHVEGGYYRRTFQADHRDKIVTTAGQRYTLTSIHYLLTRESPIGHWHLNRSDVLHFFHLGGPITYYLIHPNGNTETVIMGPDPTQGHKLVLAVVGGTWKASQLALNSEYGLISEAVSPGFEYEDMTLAKEENLLQCFPDHEELIKKFICKRNR